MWRATSNHADFGIHIEFAMNLPSEATPVSHVLFHAIFLIYHRLFSNVALSDVALVAILTTMLPLPLILFALLKKAAGNTIPLCVLVLLSLGLSIMSPVTIWTNQWMIGYVNSIVYHSPTLIAVRLFVVPVSILALHCFDDRQYSSANHRFFTLLLCACLILLTTLAKQSYTIALVPGICVFAIWRMLNRKSVDWVFLVFGIIVPGMLMLGLQYLLTYVHLSDNSRIAFGFLTVMRQWIPEWRIPIQFLLSLLFPLSVCVLYFKESRKCLYLKMSWVIFGVGAAITYLFYEEGTRLEHGNFLWNSYSAVFVLMFASMLFLIQQHAREQREGLGSLQLFHISFSRRVGVGLLLFALHVLSGVAYYFRYLGNSSL